MPDPLAVTHVVLSMDVGGLERIVLDLVREGQALGQRVDVVCLERPGLLAPQVEALGARMVCLDKQPGKQPEVIGRMRRVLRGLRPDVVHTHQIGPLWYTGPAARLARVPIVVHTEHGKERYAERRRTRWLGRLAGCFAVRFFCVSEDIAALVQARHIVARRKISVLPNGIDTARFSQPSDTATLRRSLGIPPGAPVIGTVGRLSEIKRQDVLVRGFAQVRARVPDAHLLLVGGGPLMDDLRALAGSLGIGANVHFAGYQEQPQEYLQAMDLFALTSRSEGMPLAVLEAWAAGLPVVASRVGGVPAMIEDGRTGVLFPSGDEAALAALLADPARGRAIGAAGRSRVEAAFHVRRMAGDYQRHYLELLERYGLAPPWKS